MPIKKIVLTGPESTGKSTLCKQLAAHYNTAWIPEYARDYLTTNGKDYAYADLSKIAAGQIRLEELAINTFDQSLTASAPEFKIDQPLFIDTDLYVIKTWSEFVFNKCETNILSQIAVRHYDLYLLCNTDLPWEEDELREYPDPVTRLKLYHHYKDIMVNQDVPWVNISGNYQNRFRIAVDAVDQLIKLK